MKLWHILYFTCILYVCEEMYILYVSTFHEKNTSYIHTVRAFGYNVRVITLVGKQCDDKVSSEMVNQIKI